MSSETRPEVGEPPRDSAPEPELLRRYLAGRDAACPGCGYNLRGLEGESCPECNEALVLRVSLAEPRQGAFIAGVVGLAVGIGFSVAFLSLAAVVVAMRGDAAALAAESWPLVLNLAIESIALAVWVRSRRWLRRRSARQRALLAAACWAGSAVLAAFFFMHAFEGV